MLTWLGTGLLGSNFVRALRRRGEAVQVWNRSPDKARALEADGARALPDPADAVRGATRVHLTLSDDAAVDDVLERARPGLGPDVTLVDHTTTSPAGTAARAQRWQQRGVAFLHAPVFMAPAHALAGTGLMLAAGPRARFDALAPALSALTGKLVHVGEAPERAAIHKLIGNLALMFVTTGVAEALRLARATDLPSSELQGLFELLSPGFSPAARLGRILDADFTQPSWELAMARKDARIMLDTAAAAGHPLAVLPALAAEFDRWIASGHGHHDWTVIASDVRDNRN